MREEETKINVNLTCVEDVLDHLPLISRLHSDELHAQALAVLSALRPVKRPVGVRDP